MSKKEEIKSELSPEARMLSQFDKHGDDIQTRSTPLVNRIRRHALKQFEALGFPTAHHEDWRHTPLQPYLESDYAFDFSDQSRSLDIGRIFTCDVNDLDTYSVSLLNGWYVYKQAPLTRMADGTLVGSLARAMEAYPEIIDAHFGQAASPDKAPMTALNTAFAQDGLFIYVPDGVEVVKPIQLINIVYAEKPLFLQPRHLVIAGRNSRITLVHCDHALSHQNSFTNTVVEIFAGEGSEVSHYKVQNKGRKSALLTTTAIRQSRNSRLSTHITTLNGGFTRNMIEAHLDQAGCQSNHYGLYLVDRKQHVDNQLLIRHAAPDCYSNQLYKGILDDEARAVFSGKVVVEKDAQQTQAYQSNRNLLLTDEAKVNTQPHLEIYADDVKCSHGATVGQLDPNAMFYLRSRGLCERTARQLMMYAFAREVVRHISIDALRDRLDHLVDKRLKGELSICDQCVLHCNKPEPAQFTINMDKI